MKKDNSTTQHFCKVGSFSDCILRSVVKKATSVSSGLMLNTLSLRWFWNVNVQGFCCLCALERFCIAKNYYRFGFQVGTTLILILIHNCWNISTQVINSPPYHNKLLALPKPLELQCVPAHYCIVIGYIFSSPFGKAVRLHHRNMKLIPGMSTGTTWSQVKFFPNPA